MVSIPICHCYKMLRFNPFIRSCFNNYLIFYRLFLVDMWFSPVATQLFYNPIYLIAFYSLKSYKGLYEEIYNVTSDLFHSELSF